MINIYTYGVSKRASLADKAAYKTRKKIYTKLSKLIDLEQLNSIIDVGVTADKTQISSNFFENIYPKPEIITAFSDQDASWMENEYKGLKFIRGTALDMPFDNDTFDLVFSSAVIEHVGSFKNQIKYLNECLRISKKYVFITTPNRFYPIEFHTVLPFIHWLPKKIHRKILRLLGKEFFACEENLNLLSNDNLKFICNKNKIKNYIIKNEYFLGLPSNLLLIITKES